MKMSYDNNFIVEMNSVEEGLNFLVPIEWYSYY